MDESIYLEECASQLDKEWLLSGKVNDKKQILVDSLENIEYVDPNFIIGFSAHQFFQRCWHQNIDIVTKIQPRFLLIALDHNDRLYETNDLMELWKESYRSEPLRIAFPLWDLSDQKFFNTRELRGKLSENYAEFLSRYESDFLMVLRGSLNEDLWDLRIVSLKEGDMAYLCGKSTYEIICFLEEFVITNYALSRNPTIATISFVRGNESGLKALKNAPEVIQLLPRLFTQHQKEFRIWSYWTETHLPLLEREYGLKILSYQH